MCCRRWSILAISARPPRELSALPQRTARNPSTRCSVMPWHRYRNKLLLADAERAEDQVQDVVGRGCSGDRVERAQRVVEIEQEHLVWNPAGHGILRTFQRSQ